MTQRLQKIIAASGLMARRKAEEAIEAGRVTVNGLTARIGDSADPETDAILVDGRALPSAEKKVYIMLNKPRGIVTSLRDEKGRRDVSELVSKPRRPSLPPLPCSAAARRRRTCPPMNGHRRKWPRTTA